MFEFGIRIKGLADFKVSKCRVCSKPSLLSKIYIDDVFKNYKTVFKIILFMAF